MIHFDRVLSSGLGVGLMATLMCAGNAYGSVVYDTSLTNGVYYGTGNQGTNSGFTVDTENGIEIGLRAKLTTINNPVIDTPTDLYMVPAGFKSGTTNHSAWNYDFSVDLLNSNYTFGTISASLTITDLNNGNTLIYNPLTGLPDNSKKGTTGQQNSENPLFGGFGAGALAAGYGVNNADTYTFVLKIFDANSSLIASDTILAQVAPEPSTIGLMLGGCVALFAMRRRTLAGK